MARRHSVARREVDPIIEPPDVDAIKTTILELGISLDDDWARVRIYPEQTIHGVITAPVWVFGLRRIRSYFFRWATEVPPRLAGHQVDLYGRRLPSRPHEQTPYWVMPYNDPRLGRIELLVETWRREVSTKGNPLVVRVDWRPAWDNERASILGAEHDTGRGSDGAFEEARKLTQVMLGLSIVDGRGGGRPGDYSESTEPKFFDDLSQAAHKAVREGDHVNYSTLTKYGLSKSRATVKEYIEFFDYDMNKIEAEAVSCTKKLSICAFIWRRRAEFKKNRA